MRHMVVYLFLIGMLGFNLLASPAIAAGSEEGNFQIMKATADKVWRLNKATGEISVCSLDGERLVCSSSTEAIRPPAVTYEEREAEKKRAGEERKAKSMEFLDRALAAIRSLFEASLDQEKATGN